MAFEVNSQELYQTIRGEVLDKSSELPLIGATILLANSNPINGSVTDLNGNFRFSNIPIGRQEIIVSFLGYETARLNNIDVNSKKEIVLTNQEGILYYATCYEYFVDLKIVLNELNV